VAGKTQIGSITQALSDEQMPLCVDLDDSLITTDTLVEYTFKLAKSKPWMLVFIPLWMMRGRHILKEKLAALVKLSPASLPYHSEVFFYLKRMAKRGRRIYLVTGAHESIANEVASYLGIFTKVFASNSAINLVGQNKADLLVREFGERGFDYIGDSKHDLTVWKHARHAITVGVSSKLKREISAHTRIEKEFYRKPAAWVDFIKCIRVHQWAKNALIFLPILLAHKQDSLTLWIDTILAFVSFSLLASSIYVINDLWDLEADRQHHDKKDRPFASGRLSISYAALIVPICWIGSLMAASQLNKMFLAVLGIYFIVTNVYTFYLKTVAIADIMVLASLYSLRLVAGGVIAGVGLSPWLVAFSGFFFVSLAMVKRASELLSLQSIGRDKIVGRGYELRDLATVVGFGTASGYGSVVILALYINSGVAKSHYIQDQLLWLLCPLLMYWISRVWLLTNRGQIDSDPVKFAIKDRLSWIFLVITASVWALASGYVVH
jgi:4-hydroxybenzoate polyprenyltransferase/phosphoserine phosphatase